VPRLLFFCSFSSKGIRILAFQIRKASIRMPFNEKLIFCS
jgi:hypothetical protein